VAGLCRKEGISPSLYYKWRKEFLEAGKAILAGDTRRKADGTDVKEMRSELEEFKLLVSELSLKSRVLKNACRDWRMRRGLINPVYARREAGDHQEKG